MLTYKTLTQQQYIDELIQIISIEEGPDATVRVGADNHATIGFGYTLDTRNNNVAIWQAAGITLSSADLSVLQQIDAATTQALRLSIARQFTRSLSISEATALLRQTYQQYEGPANALGMPPSYERAAFVALTYNRGVGNVTNRMGDFFSAISIGDRAEAWFQMRYNANPLGLASINGTANQNQQNQIQQGEDRGIAKRRFAESQIFGLYNDPSNVQLDEAKQAYRMLQFHRSSIQAYEDKYGGQVGNANVDYGLAGTSNEVLSLVNSLLPAEAALFADLRNTYSSLSTLDPNDYTSTNIYLDPGRDSTDPVGTLRADHRARLDARQFTIPDPITGSTELAFNDILIGEGGDDTLIGGKGDDILIGGDGEDTYVIRSGDGNDRIVDSDGKGKITFEDASGNSYTASLSAYAVSGQANTWTAFAPGGGTITFTRNSPLTITFSDGTSAVIDNYNDGDFDINLLAQPGSDTVPTNVVAGTSFNDNGTEQGGQTYASLTGAADADLIPGFLGDDSMNGGDGEDLLFGDEGRDSMAGAVGDDTLQGGADGDIAYGMDGNDVLVGDVLVNGDLQATMQAAIDSTAAPGTVKEFLNGGAGNDILIGGTGNDALSGSDGIDTLIGGSGDDVIWGDGDMLATSLDWFTDGVTFINVGGFIPPAGVGGADTIYGGAGNDLILAEAGDDYVDAGAGNDGVIGHDGNDTIFGGAGDDILDGDSNFADQAHSIPDSMQGDDYIDGGDGNDELVGNGGADTLFGGAGNDLLIGDDDFVAATYQGDDYLDGGEGDDRLFGNGGNDTLFGGAGDDYVQGDAGDDYLDGGDGIDTLYGGTGNDTLLGGAGADSMFGEAGDDYLDGGADNDQIAGGEGNDTILGGAGMDLMHGDGGDDYLDGEDDADQIAGDAGNDVIFGGGGNDTLTGNDGDDTIDGGDGDDLVDAGAGNDTVFGGAGNDSLTGGEGIDVLDGGDGDDSLFGDGDSVAVADQGADTISGGAGNDSIRGYGGDDQLFGDAGADTVFGEAGNDYLEGGSEDDLLFGDFNTETAQDGNDTLFGGDGNDQLVGNGGSDTLDGGAGADSIFGGTGNDTLTGGDGDDTLVAGTGDDTLTGGTGNDTLYGEGGSDTYIFNLGDGRDVIIEDSAVNTEVLRFGAGIAQTDLTFSRVGTGDLAISLANGTDAVTVAGWYAGTGYQMTRLEFADGSQISALDATTRGYQLQYGTEGNDNIGGATGNDTLYGLGGNDVIFGGAGNDVLIGGTGNDTLNGGAGTNTYRFDLGDGQDHIQESGFFYDTLIFGPGIASSDISYLRVGNDLVMSDVNGTDKVTVDGWYSTTTLYNLKNVRFESDGTVLTTAQLSTAGTVINDSYTFNSGDGAKLIEDWGGNDVLTFGAGLTKSAITPTRVGQDLVLTRSAVPTDKVTIKDWFNNVNKQIETVTFSATGESFTHSELTDPFLTLTGTAGADTLTGGDAYGETINGLGGNDTLSGGGGNDQITGGLGNDSLQGGLGNDRYFFKSGDGQDTIFDAGGSNVLEFGPGMVNNVAFVSSGNDVVVTFSGSTDSVRLLSGTAGVISKFELNGTTRADTITGSQYGDVIQGLGGNDSINGGDGADEIYGGAGDDTLEGGGSDTDGSIDSLYGGDGNDVLDSGLRTSAADAGGNLTGGPGNDQLFGSSWTDNYFFNIGDGVDTITDESFFGNGQWQSSPEDAIIFGPGITQDSISVRFSGSNLIVQVTPTDQITINSWTDWRYQVEDCVFADGSVMGSSQISDLAVTLKGTSGNDTLTGTSASEILLGFAGNDTLLGMGGNDRLTGGTGDDNLQGGDGNDTYYVNSGDGRDTITETSGTDTVQYGPGLTASNITLSRNINSLVLSVNGTTDSLTITNYLSNPASRVESFVFTDGSQLPSESAILDQFVNIRGTAGDDVLTGTSNFDAIFGLDGNDTLDGGADHDSMLGGPGNDVYIVDNTLDAVTELAGEGTDTVRSSATYTLSANVENLTLTGTSAVNGTGNTLDNVLLGNSANNTLNGGAGNDTLDGGAGADTLVGGLGDDTYAVDNAGDVITENAGEGTDTALATATYTLGSNVENLTLMGTAAIGGTGNDTLIGGAGNDTLDGGTGNDSMSGGTGNDIYVVDSLSDIVTENANEGIDTVQSSITYTLGVNLENLTLTGTTAINGTGNALDNILTGNSAANVLTGGAGNDTYVVGTGDSVVESANAGTDTVQSSVTFTLGTNLENLILTGTTALNGTGNTVANLLRGNSANNTLTGAAGVDVLEGGAGDDTLSDSAGTDNGYFNGGAGIDTLTGGSGREFYLGGAGNDTLNTGTGADVIAYNRGDGQDIVNASTGQDNVVSLGGGIAYSDLVFRVMGSDLVLDTGASESLTFKSWYTGTTNKSVLTLQVVAEAMAGFNPTGGDPLLDNKIETFNFQGLVNAFDAARAADPGLTSWALTNGLAQFHLSGSDTDALGGDLAYQYGENGTLAGVGFNKAQDVLTGAGFGTQAQTLRPLATLQDGFVPLS